MLSIEVESFRTSTRIMDGFEEPELFDNTTRFVSAWSTEEITVTAMNIVAHPSLVSVHQQGCACKLEGGSLIAQRFWTF